MCLPSEAVAVVRGRDRDRGRDRGRVRVPCENRASYVGFVEANLCFKPPV